MSLGLQSGKRCGKEAEEGQLILRFSSTKPQPRSTLKEHMSGRLFHRQRERERERERERKRENPLHQSGQQATVAFRIDVTAWVDMSASLISDATTVAFEALQTEAKVRHFPAQARLMRPQQRS